MTLQTASRASSTPSVATVAASPELAAKTDRSLARSNAHVSGAVAQRTVAYPESDSFAWGARGGRLLMNRGQRSYSRGTTRGAEDVARRRG